MTERNEFIREYSYIMAFNIIKTVRLFCLQPHLPHGSTIHYNVYAAADVVAANVVVFLGRTTLESWCLSGLYIM